MTELEYEQQKAYLDEMPKGTERIPHLEELIRVADQLGYKDDAFEMRMKLVRDGIFHDERIKALAAFAWCLARVDEEPERHNMLDILWKYKWICTTVGCFDEIPIAKCEELLADFRMRLRDQGYGEFAYWYVLVCHYYTINDRENARIAYAELLKQSRDNMSDCAACVQNGLVGYHVLMGDYEQALIAAEPILTGRMSCGEVPQSTYPKLFMCALMAGDEERAREFAAEGLRLMSDDTTYAGRFLIYYSCKDIKKAVELFTEFSKLDPEGDLYFHEGAAILFYSLLQKGQESITLDLPKDFELYNESSVYKTAELAEYFNKEATETHESYDKRNGNNVFQETYAKERAFVEKYIQK